MTWRPLKATLQSNVERDKVLDNVRANLSRDLPWQLPAKEHERPMLLVGGGPSLSQHLEGIRLRQRRGGDVWALNNTHDYLISRRIIPNFFAMLDARPENVEFVKSPHDRVTYYLASRCHPSVFEALSGQNVVMWHSLLLDGQTVDPELENLLGQDRPWCLIGGGGTIGMRAMVLGYQLGYRTFHLYGYDSCFQDQRHHAYSQRLNDQDKAVAVRVRDREFICAPWMAVQGEAFKAQAVKLLSDGCRIVCHGDGLIPYILNCLQEET